MLYKTKRLILIIGIIAWLFILWVYIFTIRKEVSIDETLVSTSTMTVYDEDTAASGKLLDENSWSYMTQDNRTNPIVYTSGSDQTDEDAMDNLWVSDNIDFHDTKKYYKYSSEKYWYDFYLPIYTYYYANNIQSNEADYNPDHIVTIDVESDKAKKLESASIHTAFFTYDHKDESDEYLSLVADHDTQIVNLKNGRLFIFWYGDVGADDKTEYIIQTIKESAE